MQAELVEVNLEGTMTVGESVRKSSWVEVVALSIEGAVIRTDTPPEIGEPVVLQLQNESKVTLDGRVDSHVDLSDSKKLVSLAFNDPRDPEINPLRGIIDYFYRLKRAGVQLGIAFQKKAKVP